MFLFRKVTGILLVLLAAAVIFATHVVVNLASLDAYAFVERGNRYFNVGGSGRYDLKKAEKYFLKALEKDPLVSDAWHQLARIDFLRGDFDGALEKINRQLALHGDSLMPSYYIRGLIYGYTKRFAEAEADFLKFYRWDPNNWAIYTDLSWIYFQEEKYEKMRMTAEGGLARFPNNPWLLNMAGLAHMNLGDAERARIYFQKALFWTETLKESDWHKAYPGNDPRVAGQGILEMKRAIEHNLDLLGDK